MLTQEERETELPPEGICDGKLGTDSLYHLCPVRDDQPDGELNLGRHGAFWLRFSQLIPIWQILYYRPHS